MGTYNLTHAELMCRLRACTHDHSEPVAPPPEVLTHYVIVRSDLPAGILAANIVHAAGESSPGNLPSGTHAIVLTVPDEPALRAMRARLELAQVAHVACEEPDPPYHGALMSLGLTPGRKEHLRRYVSSLPLLKKM